MLSDWFIRGVPEGKRGNVDRRRMLVQGSFVCAFVAFAFAIQRSYLVPVFEARHVNLIAACALFCVIPFVLKLTRSYDFAAHALVVLLSLVIINDCALHGSISGPPIVAFLVTPMMAAFYLGPRATVGYGVMMWLAAVMLSVVADLGLLRPVAELPQGAWLGTITGLTFLLVVVMRIYEKERDNEARKTRAIVDNLSDGVAGLSAAGIFESANGPFGALLKLPSDPTGESVDVLGEPWVESVRRSLDSGEDIATTNEVDGRVITLTTSPYEGGAVILARDITRETEVDRMKTEFTSIVSHELRTPLTSILGFARIIQKRLDSRILPLVQTEDPRALKAIETVTGNLTTIASEGGRLASLIDDMLDIAKMEAGQTSWSRQPVDPTALVRGAAKATESLFARNVRLQVEAPDGLPTIIGDQPRLHQLLLNFISNAAKFTTAGQVVVAAAVDGAHLELSVTDTGPGIAQDELVAVFGKFRQSRGTEARGTGLGLAICREIATAHGGTVHVESTLGEGSRFVARIPIEAV